MYLNQLNWIAIRSKSGSGESRYNGGGLDKFVCLCFSDLHQIKIFFDHIRLFSEIQAEIVENEAVFMVFFIEENRHHYADFPPLPDRDQ
jgi:hypothetical protein